MLMRITSVHLRCVFGLLGFAVVVLTGGCGSLDGADEANPIARTLGGTPSCERSPLPEDALTLVVLDWDGGTSVLVRDKVLSGFDVKSLGIDTKEGVTQAEFETLVIDRVREILCVLDPMDVAVVTGDGEDHPESTVVHITGAVPANDVNQIGQSHFDLCNEYLDDSAVIWGGALANRIDEADLDGWVNAFANTIAHETGHTLGFFHPNPEIAARLLPSPSTEVMRANTTRAELLKPQEFLLEQDTCPGGSGAGEMSYRVTGGVAYELDG